MVTRLLFLSLLLITPLGLSAAGSSTLILPEEPKTEGEVVDIRWQPAGAGTYQITAERVDEQGAVVESETVTFVIDPLPPPEVRGTSTVESSAEIQESIAGISPQAANIVAPVFDVIDSLRQKGVQALEAGEVWAKNKAGGEVAGENTEEDKGMTGSVIGAVASGLSFVLGALKWLLGNAGVFYPVFAISFFYLLWRLFKRMRRPSY
jgi:hypothetical protein